MNDLALFAKRLAILIVGAGLDPEGSFTGGGGGGGALQAEDLNRAAQAVSGVRKPLLIGVGSGGAPPGNFLKSMSLRMHFRPF